MEDDIIPEELNNFLEETNMSEEDYQEYLAILAIEAVEL